MKKTYVVRSPIKSGGKRYLVGSTIDLESGEAAKLRDEIGDEVPSQGNNQAPADEAELLAAITDAIGKLDVNDKTLWSKGGSPKTEAIAAVTGWPVSAADRDAAWAKINATK